MNEDLEILRRPSSETYQLQITGNDAEFVDRCNRSGLKAELGHAQAIALQPAAQSPIDTVWALAREANVGVRSLTPARNSLEEIFVTAVQEGSSAVK